MLLSGHSQQGLVGSLPRALSHLCACAGVHTHTPPCEIASEYECESSYTCLSLSLPTHFVHPLPPSSYLPSTHHPSIHPSIHPCLYLSICHLPGCSFPATAEKDTRRPAETWEVSLEPWCPDLTSHPHAVALSLFVPDLYLHRAYDLLTCPQLNSRRNRGSCADTLSGRWSKRPCPVDGGKMQVPRRPLLPPSSKGLVRIEM